LNKKRSSNNVSKEKLKRKKTSKQVKIRGPWSEREDKLLMDWIEIHGPKSWARCSETIKGRNGKQCREHWNNSLNNNIKKGEWTSEEDLYIMVFYDKLDKSWKKMIPLFKSRTENAIKNRFYSQLRKITANYVKRDKSEYNTKFKLGTLVKYYEKGIEEAKKDFLKEHPMKDDVYDSFIKEIEDLIKNKPKNQEFIDLDNIRKKYLSNIIVTNNNNNTNDENNKEEENGKIEEIQIELFNDNNNNGNKDYNKEKEDDIDKSSIHTDEMVDKTEKQKKLEENYDNKDEIIKENNRDKKTEIKSPIKRSLGFNYMNNNKYSTTINELKNGLTNGENNILGQKNITNVNINLNSSRYLTIYNNNNFNNPIFSGNVKENNNSNINMNNTINPVQEYNINRTFPNSQIFAKKPSEVGDYWKNNPCSYFKNNISTYDLPPYSSLNRINSNYNIDCLYNSYPNYNPNNVFSNSSFKPINNNNEFFNFDKSILNNKEMNSNTYYVFRHLDSNDINKLNKPNYPFSFGYNRTTSNGSIIN
jgi:hypothetical protein